MIESPVFDWFFVFWSLHGTSYFATFYLYIKNETKIRDLTVNGGWF